MSSVLLFVTLLAQSQFPDAPPPPNLRAIAVMERAAARSEAPENESAKKVAECQERQFTSSFNHLKKALDEFADAYNQGKLDLKKIEEIKKAWRDLESSEARFRLAKSKW
jgi:hypothetical protein